MAYQAQAERAAFDAGTPVAPPRRRWRLQSIAQGADDVAPGPFTQEAIDELAAYLQRFHDHLMEETPLAGLPRDPDAGGSLEVAGGGPRRHGGSNQ